MTRPWVLDYDEANCTVGAAVGIIGERWTFLVLREMFSGVRRFGDIQRRTRAPRQVLSDRLGNLVEQGLLRRVPYREQGQRTRHEYRLTDKALDLYPILVALMEWGEKHAVDAEGPAVRLTHRGCGAPIRLQITCSQGHVVGSAREVTALPGPGAHKIA